MPRASCAASEKSMTPAESALRVIPRRAALVWCRFGCGSIAHPGRRECLKHLAFSRGAWIPCDACGAPIDRILGDLATDLDRLCPAHEFKARAAWWLRTRCHR